MPTLPKLKPKDRVLDSLLIGVICLITFFYWQGVAEVPFHPDESTYLFMSADWELWATNPISLTYQANDTGITQRYRLLDPPLGRYLIGISRAMSGYLPPPADWNWALTWEQNKQAGALPSKDLLTAGRFGPAALFPFTLVLIYLTGWKLGGRFLGWTTMLFLSTNALVLLHTRRVMSEGGLVFTICLFMASLVFCRKRTWLIGIPVALMLCAKQSTLPLAIIGLLAIILYSKNNSRWKTLLTNTSLYGFILLAVFIILNPIFWSDPVNAFQAAVQARQDLLLRQVHEFGLAQPEALLNTPWKAALSFAVNLFISPPAIADVGNYLTETNAAAQIYMANPVHVLFRDIYLGGLLLAMSMIGFLLSIKNALVLEPFHRRPWILLTAAALVQYLALLISVSLPFQRYVIPLVPFVCLWIGYSLFILKEKAAKIWFNRSLAGSD